MDPLDFIFRVQLFLIATALGLASCEPSKQDHYDNLMVELTQLEHEVQMMIAAYHGCMKRERDLLRLPPKELLAPQ